MCGGRRPGAELGRVAGLEREAQPAVVEVDAGVRLGDPGTETGGVRLDQRHAHAVAVDGAQVGGVAAIAGAVALRRLVAVDHVGPRVDRVEQRLPVGAVVEDGRAVVAGGGGALDQDVRPLRIVRIVREADLLGEPQRGRA